MKKTYSHFQLTLMLTAISSFLSVYLAYLLQMQADMQNISPCSYLDPVSVDIVAFFIGLFLAIEGWTAIFRNRDAIIKNQITRCLRVCIGFSIITIHIIQFLHK